uniref:Uncharacterized protein n=1 Tax=Anopheles dirus TaxID=7168 RepID=A0A182NVY4_9DIPT
MHQYWHENANILYVRVLKLTRKRNEPENVRSPAEFGSVNSGPRWPGETHLQRRE